MMQVVSNRLVVVCKSMVITSYDDEPAEVKRKMQQNGLDCNTERIVRYDTDPDCCNHGYSQQKNVALCSPRGNQPGPNLLFRCGFGTHITDEENQLMHHPEGKYLLLHALEQFGFDVYVSVTTGELVFNCSIKFCMEQVIAFRKFALIYSSYNIMQSRAGYTPYWIECNYGKFDIETECKWPHGVSNASKFGDSITHRMCGNVFHGMQQKYKNAVEKNVQDPSWSLMNQSMLYYHAKNALNVRRNSKTLIETFKMVHSTNPQLVSLDRPEPVQYADNVICKFELCFSINCQNNANRLAQLLGIVGRYKMTAKCIELQNSKYSVSSYRERQTNSK